jgi:predicted ATPase with chaperone activity
MPVTESKILNRRQQGKRFTPAVPTSLADTGLPSSLIEQLILKILYSRGDTIASDVSRAIGLTFNLLDPIIERFKNQHVIQVKHSLGYGPISSMLSLTETGRRVARDHLEKNLYTGPAPVPVKQYAAAVDAQRLPDRWLTPERLATAYTHMVMHDNVLDQIGPAVNAGKSFLIYGQPGNGKTYTAEALSNINTSNVYLPYALECQGNIILLYDPVYHEAVDDSARGDDTLVSNELLHDGRWIRCRRPFIVTGGELDLSMLDLGFDPVSKIYEAPFQLKANNGTYLIDDFGRQKATTAEILNRWMIPMERRVDYLSFSTGGKMAVPFETFLIFSTNQTPDKIGDEAFLRRIQYKMLLRSPDEDEFRSIFQRVCEEKGLHPETRTVDRFISKHYVSTGRPFRRCHPRDILLQAIECINFKRLPYELTDELLDQAFAGCFLSDVELSDPSPAAVQTD